MSQDVGEAEQGGRHQGEADWVKRTVFGLDERWCVCDQQQSAGRQGQWHHAEKDPRPGLAIDQPALQGRGDSRRGDHCTHGKQGLQKRLLVPCIGAKDDGLTADQQGTAAKALDDAQGDQQIQAGAEGRQGAGQAHRQRGAHHHVAGVEATQQPGGAHEPDQLERGVADVQPGKLIWRGIGVANDVATAER
ncbi:hypothetical protein D3C79_860070 [compost metagenome]